VICLTGLYDIENLKYLTDDLMSTFEPGKNNLVLFIDLKRKAKSFWYKCKEFHQMDLNINKKPYMITPCKHIFHSECLEAWLKMKKECPSCRQEIRNF
jgi:hypothetical protein